jgi:RHS repeat-associated protein
MNIVSMTQQLLLIIVFVSGLFDAPRQAHAEPDPGQLVFYHTDHLGSTTAITDATGKVLQLLEYDPWGQVVKDIGDNYAHYRYTGQEYDPEIGLYNYKARLYAPAIGRFISPDSVVPEPGNPQSLNRYAYVMNNPMRYVDPSGNSWWESFLIGLAAGIVGGIVFAFTLNPVLAGMAGGFVAGAIQGGIATGTWQGALMGGIMGAAMGMVGGGIVEAAGVWGAIGLAAASLGVGYATGGWAGVGNVLAMMAGGFIGGMIGYGIGSALSSIGTVDPGEAEFLGYEDDLEVVELPDAIQWPVGDVNPRITQPFTGTGPGQHSRINIANPLNAPVHSTENGRVIFVGQDISKGTNYILVQGDSGYQQDYFHTTPEPGIIPGARVTMGQIIGRTDLSGVTTGPHLHFAVSPGNFMNIGTRINPIGNYLLPFSYGY